MNEQLAYEGECPENHMAPDEPTDYEMALMRKEEEAKQNVNRWRRMPDKTLADCLEWLEAAHVLEYTYDEDIDTHLWCTGVESEDLTFRLLTGLKECYMRHNENGQYDEDIAFRQADIEKCIGNRHPHISYGYHLQEMVRMLERYGHDKNIFGLSLELIDQKINGCVIHEMKEALEEIYVRLIGF